MVKQADGWESGMSAELHRWWSNYWVMPEPYSDEDALRAEYHEACAEGRTTAAEESDRE